MKKIGVLACLLLASLAANAQTTQQQCAAAMQAPSIQLPGSPTCTSTLCSYTDNTNLVDGAEYGYVAVAMLPLGYSCSNILLNVAIPATGAHTVALTFDPSSTSGVQNAIFRAQNPANPTGLSYTVN